MPKIILSVKLTRLHGTKCGDADALKVCVVSTTTHEYMGHQIRSQTMVVKPPPLTEPQAQQRSKLEFCGLYCESSQPPCSRCGPIHYNPICKNRAGSVPQSYGRSQSFPSMPHSKLRNSNTARTAKICEHESECKAVL